VSGSPEDCTNVHNRRTFTVSEQRSRLAFDNPDLHEISQTEVDGCVFTVDDAAKRCDWKIVDEIDLRAVYVELKGSHVGHAISQIEETHKSLPPVAGFFVEWIVCCSGGIPPTTETQADVDRLKRRRITLHVRRSGYRHLLRR